MKTELKAVIFDIDGVITDGKKYTDGISQEFKSVACKDMDAITAFGRAGIFLGCISGEDTAFSRSFFKRLDFCCLGEKDKRAALDKFCRTFHINRQYVCYVGDGVYDIEAIRYAGYGVCPHDALPEVKEVSDLVLNTSGGQGCIAELYTLLCSDTKTDSMIDSGKGSYICPSGQSASMEKLIKTRLHEHSRTVEEILTDKGLMDIMCTVCREIIRVYRTGGRLFLCGNGGSAADAQHLAAEMVGRFYLERRAYAAEALTADTSVLTCLGNDYCYEEIFARQVEAKGQAGDILLGITTSGKSKNILRAFEMAKEKGMVTILLTGKKCGALSVHTDYAIHIPSADTARIQECHILAGHIICEIIEAGLSEGEKEWMTDTYSSQPR